MSEDSTKYLPYLQAMQYYQPKPFIPFKLYKSHNKSIDVYTETDAHTFKIYIYIYKSEYSRKCIFEYFNTWHENKSIGTMVLNIFNKL